MENNGINTIQKCKKFIANQGESANQQSQTIIQAYHEMSNKFKEYTAALNDINSKIYNILTNLHSEINDFKSDFGKDINKKFEEFNNQIDYFNSNSERVLSALELFISNISNTLKHDSDKFYEIIRQNTDSEHIFTKDLTKEINEKIDKLQSSVEWAYNSIEDGLKVYYENIEAIQSYIRNLSETEKENTERLDYIIEIDQIVKNTLFTDLPNLLNDRFYELQELIKEILTSIASELTTYYKDVERIKKITKLIYVNSAENSDDLIEKIASMVSRYTSPKEGQENEQQQNILKTLNIVEAKCNRNFFLVAILFCMNIILLFYLLFSSLFS